MTRAPAAVGRSTSAATAQFRPHLEYQKTSCERCFALWKLKGFSESASAGSRKTDIISAEVNGTRAFVPLPKIEYILPRSWKTFHDFLTEYIRTVVGSEWGNAGGAGKSHLLSGTRFFAGCSYIFVSHQQKFITSPGEVDTRADDWCGGGVPRTCLRSVLFRAQRRTPGDPNCKTQRTPTAFLARVTRHL